MSTLKVFKLEPIQEHLDSHHWQASKYKGEAIIVAEDENDARRIASINLGALGAIKSGTVGQVPSNPWKLKAIVLCNEVDDTNISTDKKGIVIPEEFIEDE